MTRVMSFCMVVAFACSGTAQAMVYATFQNGDDSFKLEQTRTTLSGELAGLDLVEITVGEIDVAGGVFLYAIDGPDWGGPLFRVLGSGSCYIADEPDLLLSSNYSDVSTPGSYFNSTSIIKQSFSGMLNLDPNAVVYTNSYGSSGGLVHPYRQFSVCADFWGGLDTGDVLARLYVTTGCHVQMFGQICVSNNEIFTGGDGILTYVFADPGGPYTINNGETLTLDGSNSARMYNQSLSWDLDNDGEFDDATGVTPSVSYEYLTDTLHLSPGRHYVALQVNEYDQLIDVGWTYIDVVPEPSMLVLFGIGAVGLLAYSRRRK